MRTEGWEALLAAHIEQVYREPFIWGQHDCVLWVADWISKVLGDDPAKDIRGRYDSERGALQIMKKRGFANVEAIADGYFLSVPVTLARRGDLLLHPKEALGICTGKDGVFLMLDGVTTIGTLECPKAWRVE